MFEELKMHGVTESTPKNIMIGAGTIHKGFKFDTATKKWNFAESLIGATSGGNKLSIIPNIITVEMDGALVKTKGLDFKQGEVAKLETNLVEITPELIKNTVIGQMGNSDIEGYDLIESKSNIEDGDYLENLAFVGKKTDGTPIIIILDNALCTTGFEAEAKNKGNTVVKCTFECYADTSGDLSKLPYHIYVPSSSTTQATQAESNGDEGEENEAQG